MVVDFLERTLENQYEKRDVDLILEGLRRRRKTTVRVNTLKSSMSEIKKVFENEGILVKDVEWNDFALIIETADESRIRKLEVY